MKTSTLLLSFSLVVSTAGTAAAQKPAKKDDRAAVSAPAKPARKLEVRHGAESSTRASHRGARGLDPNAGIQRRGFLTLQESRRERAESMTELFANARHESARQLSSQHSVTRIEASARPSATLHIEFDPSPLAFMDEEAEKERAAAGEREHESKARRGKDRRDRD